MNAPQIILAVPLATIRRLEPFVSTEEIRYHLNGVRFESAAEGPILAATDGHRLGVIHCDDALVNEPGIVRMPGVPKLDRLQRKERQWLVVGKFAGEMLSLVVSFPGSVKADEVAERTTVSKALLIAPRPLIEGDFPDWRRVIPSKIGRKTASFNPNYLGDFIKAIGAKSGAITLYGDSDNEPHLVSTGQSDFIGVQMPMRADGITKLPDWLAPVAPVKAKKAA